MSNNSHESGQKNMIKVLEPGLKSPEIFVQPIVCRLTGTSNIHIYTLQLPMLPLPKCMVCQLWLYAVPGMISPPLPLSNYCGFYMYHEKVDQ